MRTLYLPFALTLIVLILVVPAEADAPGTTGDLPIPAPTGGDDPLPGPDADALWYYITTANPYWEWQPFPGPGEPPIAVTELPHGDWVSVYVNNTAYESMFDPLEPFSMRYGSILVKENFPASDTPPARDSVLSLTVMYKVRGYRTIPNEDEWFWSMYSPSGRVLQLSDQQGFIANGEFKSFKGEVQAGKPWFCIHCHLGAAESSKSAVGDFVWKLLPFAAKSE